MRAKINLAISLAIAVMSLTTFGQNSRVDQAASSDGILDRQILGESIDSLTTTDAFSKTLAEARLPGGVITISGCEEEPQIHVWKPAGSSLRQVLDAITSTDLQYRWQFEDGVVNLIPISGNPPLLNTHISKFQDKGLTSLPLAFSKLSAIPEVRKAAAELGLSESFSRLQGSVEVSKPGFSVRCNNVTLIKALNAIVRSRGRGVWQYKERHCNGRAEYSINFVVQ